MDPFLKFSANVATSAMYSPLREISWLGYRLENLKTQFLNQLLTTSNGDKPRTILGISHETVLYLYFSSSVLFSLLLSGQDSKSFTKVLEKGHFCAPIRNQQHLNPNPMTGGGLFGHRQSNLIKPPTQSWWGKWAEFLSVKLLINNT